MKSYTALRNYYGSISQNTSANNLTLGDTMINDAHRYLLQKYFNNEGSFTMDTVGGQQEYDVPFNYSKMKTVTVTVGQLKWTMNEILTRKEFDYITMLPYNSDIPQFYFIYNGKVNIWPIPSTTGNTITFNYKFRVPDLSIPDYTTGTITLTHGSRTVTGSTTSWVTAFVPTAGSVLGINLWIRAPYPAGDNEWYQISSVDAAGTLTLVRPYEGSSTSGASYTIGQMPLLIEDFHDLCAYRPLMIYFSSIQSNTAKHEEFKGLYDEGIKMLDDYAGQKSVNVDLGSNPQPVNPNLFFYVSQ